MVSGNASTTTERGDLHVCQQNDGANVVLDNLHQNSTNDDRKSSVKKVCSIPINTKGRCTAARTFCMIRAELN